MGSRMLTRISLKQTVVSLRLHKGKVELLKYETCSTLGSVRFCGITLTVVSVLFFFQSRDEPACDHVEHHSERRRTHRHLIRQRPQWIPGGRPLR